MSGGTAVERPVDRTSADGSEPPAPRGDREGSDGGGGSGGRGSRRRRRRRGRRAAVALAALAAGGAVAAASLGLGRDTGSPDGGTAAGLPPNTAEVTEETLEDVHSEDGRLGHGTAVTAASRRAGTLTGLPETGERITRGESLYRVDDRPVTLLYGKLPAYRPLKEGVEGTDVRQLERNLDALGYGGFTVDEEFTDRTADAVREWQEDLGVPETGSVEAADVVVASGAVRVDGLEAAAGDPLAPGGKVLSYTGTDKAVTLRLDTADQRLAKKGSAVGITLPDGTEVAGRVEEWSTVVEAASGEADAETEVEVVVGLHGAKARRAADGYALAAVDVTFTAETRENVLTVPVSALLVLSEGGFGVEVVSGTESSYVPVRTGLFADGRVEISGDGVAEGTTVGIPK
ncbi:peptidoglycan-binding protein [Streptomyces sp. NPDC014894]|uniref:peptidoglycan-binding protein n=1 Tax=Streptomyces sp. NPDC014894 TaxID=3364931 RepID=UPI0036FB6F43